MSQPHAQANSTRPQEQAGGLREQELKQFRDTIRELRKKAGDASVIRRKRPSILQSFFG